MTEEQYKEISHLRFRRDDIQKDLDKLKSIGVRKPQKMFMEVYDKGCGCDKPYYLFQLDLDQEMLDVLKKIAERLECELQDIQKKIDDF